MSLKEKAKEIVNHTSRVYICLKTNKVPWYAKLVGGITIMYALSPIDLIPDFIPILGYLDDIIILPLLIMLTIKLIPYSIWIESEDEAKEMWQSGKPKKWTYAIPIFIIWLTIFGLAIWLILKD